MPILNVIGQQITPQQDEHVSLQKRFDLKVETRLAVQVGAVRGVETRIPLDYPDEEVVELEYSNGLREWTTVGEVRQRYEKQARDRGEAGDIIISAIPPESDERGAADFLLKGLKILGIDPTDAIAEKGVRAIVEHFEEKLPTGLYRINQQGGLGDQVTGEIGLSDKPYLLLLHGTFSSVDGTFHNLFASRQWVDLWNYYEGRIVGFNHYTLSQSPAKNALDIISHLPKGAKLHIVSHSRGGLVGELLCMDAISVDDLSYFDKAQSGSEIETLRKLSEQLVARQLDVRRFVRVACPARGTLLVSERLDRYLSVILNLLGMIPALTDNLLYDFAKSTILTLIKKRADANDLPGLAAMIPTSPLVGMLNRAGRKSSSDLAVVAGDVAAGGGIGNTLKTWISDLFYREDHDLVVHTKAMYGGLERKSNAVYYFRSAADMNHFNYFLNDESRSEVYGWLTQKAGEQPEGFHNLAQVRERIKERSRSELPDDAPVVILIPGVFASHLKVTSQRIWIDLENLAVGKLERLALSSKNRVSPDGVLEDTYGDLIDALSARFKVIPHDYDWRNSFKDESKKLAEVVEKELKGNHTVYLLAHSSGGLLARALMAYQSDTWNKVCKRGGRLVMLGTPNRGTYAMLEILSGQAELIRMLDLLDSKHDLAEICKQFRRYPGLVELLPHGREDWQNDFVATLSGDDKKSFDSLRQDAVELWKELDSAIDSAHMCYIAGTAPTTVGGIKKGEKKTLIFSNASNGDGFVTAELGRLTNVPTWTMDAAHGEMVNRPEYFSALADLLLTGNTGRLKKESVVPPLVELPPRRTRLVLYPNWQEFIAAAMSRTEPKPAATTAGPTVTLNISVLHASLEHATYPLAIGHYEGDTIVGAEAVLDSKLDGRLSQRRLMNLYPGKVGTVDVILNPQGQSQGEAKGALVIGLGEVGEITPDVVSRGITEAALRLALAKLDLLDCLPVAAMASTADPLAKRRVSAAFSVLLIGTRGVRALSIKSAVAATVKGALMANRVLAERGLLDRACVDAVEFVEVYGDLATQAAHTVTTIKQYLRIAPMANEEIKSAEYLRHGEGGYAGQPPSEYDADWWQPLQIKETTDHPESPLGGELQFLRLTDRARAELTLQATQRALVERLVDKTIHDPSPDLDLPATLYELLLPNELKEQPLESTNLLLVLNSKAAQYPWEMLAERSLGREVVGEEPFQPLSVQVGMVRQLETGRYRPHVQAPRGKNALVIGEPLLDDPSYPPLPGAKAEAEAVVSVLSGFGYAVTPMIQKDALEIMNVLYAKEYRIIHIAGHGIYQPDNKAQSGVVLGKDIYLTAAEIEQLRVVPELVFLNCCHLGRIDAGQEAQQGDKQPEHRAWNKLAASVSETLIKIGVRVVVAAGWAVNDRAARNFAEALYRRMLSDNPAQFGDAVRMARTAIYESDRNTNTWGAYQCYGDPGFVLKIGDSQPSLKSYVTPQEFVFDLRNLQARASRTKDKGWTTRYKQELQQMEERLADKLPAKWRSGEMSTEIGDTYSELGDFKLAILRYRDALLASSPRELVPIRTIEQLANLEARLAVQLSQSEDEAKKQAEAEGWKVDELLANALKRLELLHNVGETTERNALLGSYYKRRAMVSGTDEARKAELARCVTYYKNAYEMSKDSDTPYSGLNWINCQVFVGIDDDDQRTKLREAFEKSLVSDPSKTTQDFWDRVKEGDIELSRLLLDETEEAIEKVQRHYQQAFEVGGTTRQCSTVIENLEFVVHMLQKSNKTDVAEKLQGVVDVLKV